MSDPDISVDADFRAKLYQISDRMIFDFIRGRPKVPPVLYHYTDAGGFLGIIRSNSIRASDARLLNDPLELTHCLSVWEQLACHEFGETFPEATRLMRHGILENAALRSASTFVASLSANRDQLSQWRAYAADGFGYAIGFNTSALMAFKSPTGPINGVWHAVLYDDSAKLEFLKYHLTPLASFVEQRGDLGVADEIIAGIALSNSLQLFLATMKQAGFVEEVEWRAIYHFEPDPGIVQFRASARGVVPYVELSPSPDGCRLSIAEVVVGPRLSDAAAQAVELLLRSRGNRTKILSAWDESDPGPGTVAIRRSRTQYG